MVVHYKDKREKVMRMKQEKNKVAKGPDHMSSRFPAPALFEIPIAQ